MKAEHPMLQECREFMQAHDPEPSHAAQVALLAAVIWRGCSRLHGADDAVLRLLISAALLHDVGWKLAPDGARHHKLSAKMVRDHSWATMNKAEVDMVALIARYHRRAEPSPRHRRYSRLNEESQKRVCQAAAVLRIADALDRSHAGLVKRLEVRLDDGMLKLSARAQETLLQESAALRKKKSLFERSFNVAVELRCVVV